jgi:hypothetical protein
MSSDGLCSSICPAPSPPIRASLARNDFPATSVYHSMQLVAISLPTDFSPASVVPHFVPQYRSQWMRPIDRIDKNQHIYGIIGTSIDVYVRPASRLLISGFGVRVPGGSPNQKCSLSCARSASPIRCLGLCESAGHGANSQLRAMPARRSRKKAGDWSTDPRTEQVAGTVPGGSNRSDAIGGIPRLGSTSGPLRNQSPLGVIVHAPRSGR